MRSPRSHTGRGFMLDPICKSARGLRWDVTEGEKEWFQKDTYMIFTPTRGKYINKSITRALSSVHASFLYFFYCFFGWASFVFVLWLEHLYTLFGKERKTDCNQVHVETDMWLVKLSQIPVFLYWYKTGKFKCSLTISRNSKTLTKTHSLATLSPLKSRKLSKSLDPELHYNKSNTL